MSSEFEAGVIQELATGVRRLVAPNPSMMTGPGTNTYLLGHDEIGVIDPGPAIDLHIERIQETAGARIAWILVTHTHPDHSPAAAKLAAATGAELLGHPVPHGRHQDQTFKPGRIPQDGDVFEAADFSLQIVETPGHASNHLCYLHTGLNWLFTGDHIINGSTVVIDPPDGNMGDYIRSLERLRDIQISAIAPGHGALIDDPYEVIEWHIKHRLERESKVVAALKGAPNSTSRELVAEVYKDVDEKLHELAEHSLLAHLIRLEEECRATMSRGRWKLNN
ncbi:MAG: glyoxylase-like metal-dependent hydrolase (beta-lactamase superfamily II) [Woeseiaceae bacterium]|jgi:glyoxylase-like metal-dependent hydrolase (beta-lactamase superfamily II)